jgi:nitroimidazol reductase NimA-like FMN-containing flavoprotein (pyridoxamine 5'-phosphate oxidase superfamily)
MTRSERGPADPIHAPAAPGPGVGKIKRNVGRVIERSHVRRQPSRGRYDLAAINAVLDAGYVAHVAFVQDNQPFCIPMLYARIGGAVYVHGSSASRTIRLLSTGVPACLTVTILDGLVLARSAFEHSANYRSAVLLGAFRRVDRDDERLAAFAAFTNQVIPGRWAEVREPNRQELKASQILALPIAEASVKVRSGPPTDDDSPDAERDVWAGVLPLHTIYGPPEAASGLRSGIPLSQSARRLIEGHAGPGTSQLDQIGDDRGGRPPAEPDRHPERDEPNG